MHQEAKASLVSIIIPTYNHGHFLGRALQSVLTQSYTNWEAIVVDNHSTDNTDEVLAGYTDPRIKVLKIHNHGVIAASRNMGIREAKGAWVAFLDSDDWWDGEKLAISSRYFLDSCDLLYHKLLVHKEPLVWFNRKKTIRSWTLTKPVLQDLIIKGNAIATSSVVVRKRLLDQIGGMDEQPAMIASEDYNAWIRIAALTDQFVYINRILGHYYEHNQSASKKDMSSSMRFAVSEFLHILTEAERLRAESWIAYAHARFLFEMQQCIEARSSLWYCVRYGAHSVRLKSFVMLADIYRRRLLSEC